MRTIIAIACITAGLVGAAPVSVSGGGWTITADAAQQVVRIEHDRLGTVLGDVRLSVGSQPVGEWSAAASPEGVLSIRTEHPRGAWQFEPASNSLVISSTASNAELTGTAPAPETRIVARLLDPEGAP